MNPSPFIFLLFASVFLSGCQSTDEWAKKAANTFLKTTGMHQQPAQGGPPSDVSSAEIKSTPVRGSIELSGPDTAMVGTILDTGFVGTMLASGQSPDFAVVVDRQSTLTHSEPSVLSPHSRDPDNGVVLVVTDAQKAHGVQGISMSIVINSVKYDYVCTTDGSPSMQYCGNGTIKLDIPNRFLALSNASTANADTGTLLGLNGRLDW